MTSDFSLLQNIQISLGDHPAYSIGTLSSFPTNKVWPKCEAEQSTPFSAKVKNEYRYTFIPCILSRFAKQQLYY